jgi:hypothetical protein
VNRSRASPTQTLLRRAGGSCPALERSLAYQNEKTSYYRMALVLMLCGLALYVAAIAMMLLDPRAGPPWGTSVSEASDTEDHAACVPACLRTKAVIASA